MKTYFDQSSSSLRSSLACLYSIQRALYCPVSLNTGSTSLMMMTFGSCIRLYKSAVFSDLASSLASTVSTACLHESRNSPRFQTHRIRRFPPLPKPRLASIHLALRRPLSQKNFKHVLSGHDKNLSQFSSRWCRPRIRRKMGRIIPD